MREIRLANDSGTSILQVLLDLPVWDVRRLGLETQP